MTEAVSIKELVLHTSDLKGTASFYGDLLGFPAQWDKNKNLRIGIGWTDLVFRSSESGMPFYHFAINVPANRFEVAVDWIRKRVPLLEEDGEVIHEFSDWNAKGVYFHDPSGNIVEFIARDNLPEGDEPQQGFSAKELLCVSEIGWPMKEPRKALDFFRLPVWRDYGSFLAMGAETGMVVVCQEGRGWKPTRRAAEIFPIELSLEVNGREINYVTPSDDSGKTL